MPNHVYCFITVSSDEDSKILEKMSKNEYGIAGSLVPMPEDLHNTTAPNRIVTEKDKEISDVLIDKYKFNNWYDWSIHNWGTKWGCYDNEMDGDVLRFTTAWSTMDESLIELLAKKIPNFTYTWEEETGWGGWMNFEDGVCVQRTEYDEPDWAADDFRFYIDKSGNIKVFSSDEIEMQPIVDGTTVTYKVPTDTSLNLWKEYATVTYLGSEHTTDDGTFKVGYYEEYDLQCFLGKTIKEALQSVSDSRENDINHQVPRNQTGDLRNQIIWG
tara:strand:- start:694 stop:1506 length:813 start_codon:yes stop_codon:yes gene_type:complete